MFLYTVVEAIVAVVAGIFIARRAKRSDGVIYSRLDKAGRITNVFLALIYAVLSPLVKSFSVVLCKCCDDFQHSCR